MKLSFYPRGDATIYEPGSVHAVGQPPRYVGKKFDQTSSRLVTNEEPYSCDSESAAAARMRKHVSRGDAWPADKQTADFLGVVFVQVSLVNGEFVAVSEPLKKSSSGNKGS